MDPVTIALSLAQFAPSILRFFGVGEKPVTVAEKVGEIAKVITGAANPEQALAAMRENAQLAHQFQMAVLQADTELERLYLADRQGARQRDIDLRKLTGGTNRRADLMIIGDVLGMLACLAAMVYCTWLGVQGATGEGDVSPIIMAINGPLGMLTQQFANGLRDAHNFEFGSSRGSEVKTELLAKAPSIRP